ncbi:MAG: hypothetical protein IJ859_01080 [Synergistaceae bacterium]|nr:hypothetical protein [Synergistaceae bacterium]
MKKINFGLKNLSLGLDKLNFAQNKKGENFENTEFRRIFDKTDVIHDHETGAEEKITRKILRVISSSISTRKNFVTLVPMKSLSMEEFTFPFANNTKIREALKLQVMPFSAAGDIEIFPVVTSKAGRGVNGLVWYVTPDELNIPAVQGGNNKVWPAPLPFISKLQDKGGSGVTMWLDEKNISSILWQNNKPVLSRWRKVSDNTSHEKELEWYDNYCKSSGLERGGNFILNAGGDYDDEPDEEFVEMISESVKICPWISNVNLSRTAIEDERDLARTVGLLTVAACWLLAIGTITLGASFLYLIQTDKEAQAVRTRSENFYIENFDPEHTGRISNPVTLARNKISEVTGSGGDGHPFEEILADMGEIFANNNDLKINLDTIRYNGEGVDCTGSAPDMTTILNFRRAWNDYASTVQVDNTQFVSGIGYRFDLRVRW